MAEVKVKGAGAIKHGGIFNRYANMTFPPYQYHEYPKHIKVDGKTVVVNSKEEEASHTKPKAAMRVEKAPA